MLDPKQTRPRVALSTITLAALACLATGCRQPTADTPKDATAADAKGEKKGEKKSEKKGEKKGEVASKPDSKAANADVDPDAKAKPATPPPSTAPALAPGWTRVELSAVVPGLTGTVDAPSGVTAKLVERQEGDADGLDVEARGLSVGSVGLEAPANVPPRFASPEAMAKFHGNFKQVSTHKFGPDHWAVVQEWRAGECMLHGWSAPAGLICNVFKAPCDKMEQWVQVCASLQPGAKPNESPTTPKSAFPTMEEAAAKVAITAARAVVGNDPAKLLSTVGPKGVKVLSKAHTSESLKAALAGKTVLQVVAPIFHEIGGDPESLYGWNSHASGGGDAKVWFSSGYGEQPYLTLSKVDGTWYVTEFGVEDLGEP